jgi:hypothetical protein
MQSDNPEALAELHLTQAELNKLVNAAVGPEMVNGRDLLEDTVEGSPMEKVLALHLHESLSQERIHKAQLHAILMTQILKVTGQTPGS